MENEPRPVYTEQQKLRAIRLHHGIEPDHPYKMSVAKIATDMGCSEASIRRWINKYNHVVEPELNPYDLSFNGVYSKRWLAFYERIVEREERLSPLGKRLDRRRLQRRNGSEYVFEVFNGCLHVQGDYVHGEPVKLRDGAVARMQFIEWLIPRFVDAQEGHELLRKADPSLNKNLHLFRVSGRLDETMQLVPVGQVPDYRYLSLARHELLVGRVWVIEFTELNRLEQAMTLGLPLPRWVLHTATGKYQVGWVGTAEGGLGHFDPHLAARPTRTTKDRMRSFADTPVEVLGKRLAGAEAEVFDNPMHPEADLLLTKACWENVLSPSTLTAAVENSYAPARVNPAGTQDPMHQSFAYELAVQNGRRGGLSRSEKKVSSARRTVSRARETRQAQASIRKDAARKMLAEGLSREAIQQALGVSYRQVQRYLSVTDIL